MDRRAGHRDCHQRLHVGYVQTHREWNREAHARCQLSASAVELMEPIGHV